MSQPSEITKGDADNTSDNTSNKPNNTTDDCPWYSSKGTKKSKYNYIILAVVVFIVLYYAYNRFYKNSEEFTEVNSAERSDPVSDFNLREAINELEHMQKKIISGLSASENY